MKAGIHPQYEECVIKCACGETVTTKSTKGGEMRVEICSKCHPFFTGKQKFVDAGGRVDKFKKRLHLEQISTLISPPLVDLVVTVSPHAHLMTHSSY